MWKKLMKNGDLGEPTSFLDHVFLGCTQRECKPNEMIIDQYRDMFESRISAGATEKLPGCAGLPQPPDRSPHGCTVGIDRDPSVWHLHPGRMMEVPERQLLRAWFVAVQVFALARMRWWSFYRQLSVSARRVGKTHAKTVAWSYDMEGRAQKCVERCCELANSAAIQRYQVLAWMITISRKRNLNQLEICQKYAHKLS